MCRSTDERFLLDFPLEEYLYIELLFRLLTWIAVTERATSYMYRKV
jgi:hypothetical protein